jgi:hypothetical protein
MHRRQPIRRACRLAGRLALVAILTQAAIACEDTPTEPTPDFFTENFSGSLGAGESVVHQFTVQVRGSISIVLATTALEPPPDGTDPTSTTIPPLGLGIGTWDGTTCTRIAENGTSFAGTAITGTALPGTFCAIVYDSGGVADRVAYTGQVTHP